MRVDLGSGARLYRHFDFRQNVKFTSDDGGVVVSHVRYDPYGVDEVLGSAEDPVRFVGRPELGDLAVLGARIYDPAVGRFLSQDPLLDSANQYAYTPGNPVWFTDPEGLRSGLASAIEDAAGATAFFAGTGAVIAAGTAAAPVLAGVAIGIGGLAFALMLARRGSTTRSSSVGSSHGAT
ncbi:MAG: hypothetical protein GWN25_24365, partial [Actinobacteria bacterium]|nr:hypothetical protein [Actinomycetota bacterium]